MNYSQLLTLHRDFSLKNQNIDLMIRRASVKKLAAMLMCLQVTDGLLTMWATNNGFREANSLMEPIAQTWMFPAWKIVSVLLGMVILFPLARRMPKAANLGLFFASAVMIGILAANLSTLMNTFTALP